MSAIYLSKVAAGDPAGYSSNPARDQSSSAEKNTKPIKMSKDQKLKTQPLEPSLSRPQQEVGDICETNSYAPTTQSREVVSQLYQQRQRCELKRLLKHTHPELKTLDGVVDEELAEVLSLEGGSTAAETGYEGEVLSRRLIFENCAMGSSEGLQAKTYPMEEGAVQGDVMRTSALFEQFRKNREKNFKETMDNVHAGFSSEDPTECEEGMVRTDIQSARRIFENQTVDILKVSQNSERQSKVVSEEDREALKKSEQVFETGSEQKKKTKIKSDWLLKNLDSTSVSQNLAPSITGSVSKTELGPREKEVFERKSLTVSNAEMVGETSQKDSIHTSADLYANNPFIAANIPKEHPQRSEVRTQISTSPSDDRVLNSRPHEDMLLANVKNRAQLFESMPFDRINQENREEKESMMESINKSLNSLYSFNVIHSHGSIIEVMETGNAKRAKYLLSQNGPEIVCDELAAGGIKNCILHLLPRAVLRPQVMYLKEDVQGNMEITMVDVPVNQHDFSTNQEREFRTANVVQLLEDILSQDSSLRKGVVIQVNIQGCVEVTVYSLYYHVEGKVRRYCPLHDQGMEPSALETSAHNVDRVEREDIRKGDVKSTISSLLASAEDQSRTVPFRREVDVKGNVKLFRSCIEKGDLEYLKTFQTEPSENELSNLPGTVAEHSIESLHEQEDQRLEQTESEWVPVDVKKLKSMFSSKGKANHSKERQKPMTHVNAHCNNLSAAQHGLNKIPSESLSESDFNETIATKQVINQCLWEFQAADNGNNSLQQNVPFCPQSQNEDVVHQAKFVEVVDDDQDEISNLQAAISSLQQATLEAKNVHCVTKARQPSTSPGISNQESQAVILENLVNQMNKAETEACLPKITVQTEKTCLDSKTKSSLLPSSVTSEHKSDSYLLNQEASCGDTFQEAQLSESCDVLCQEDTEAVHDKLCNNALKPLQSFSNEEHQEEKEEVVGSSVQAALDSLSKHSFNVTKGDFRTAMIYRNSSKSCIKSLVETEEKSVILIDCESTAPETGSKVGQVTTEELCAVTSEPENPGQTTNKPTTCFSSEQTLPMEHSVRMTLGPKPAIPPKPDHLKINFSPQKTTEQVSAKTEIVNESQIICSELKTQNSKKEKLPLPIKSLSYKDALCKGLSQTIDFVAKSQKSPLDPEREVSHCFESMTDQTANASQSAKEIILASQVQDSKGSPHTINNDNSFYTNCSKMDLPHHMNTTEEGKCPKTFPAEEQREKEEVIMNIGQNCEGKKEGKIAPKKPKRAAMSQKEVKNQRHSSERNSLSTISHSTVGQQCITDNKVVMREKKARSETEDEWRQRLSVHMNDIMRGNGNTAMEIFDNLRKQEELQNILTKVEEIEQDTSQVDVRSLKTIFENVPSWAVISRVKKPCKYTKVEQRVKFTETPKDDTESVSSMALVFGDLERASEEIMNLKEQTLARLMDIEVAIKKALYSVSALKSDSDIAGLSGLFKESLNTKQSSPTISNISKISIGSSRAKQSQAKICSNTGLSNITEAEQRPAQEGPPMKPQVSPPSSPSFICIESAARMKAESDALPQPHLAKSEQKFCSTKTLTCNSDSSENSSDPNKDNKDTTSRQAWCRPNAHQIQERQVSVLEVETTSEEKISNQDNCVRPDKDGKLVSFTKPVVPTLPDNPSKDEVVSSTPAGYQVVTRPKVRLPKKKKPSSK